MTKEYVFQKAAPICVYILVAEKRPNTAKLLGYLRVEGGHVVHRRTLLVGMANEEAFVQELDSMSDVHNMPVDDSLAKPDAWSTGEVTDAIVIDRPANLQT